MARKTLSLIGGINSYQATPEKLQLIIDTRDKEIKRLKQSVREKDKANRRLREEIVSHNKDNRDLELKMIEWRRQKYAIEAEKNYLGCKYARVIDFMAEKKTLYMPLAFGRREQLDRFFSCDENFDTDDGYFD